MKNQKKYGLRFLLVIGSIVTLLMASSINAYAEDKEGQVRWDLTDLFANDAAWEQAFTEIQTKIKSGDRTFTDKKPLGTNYYKVVAYRDSTAQKLSYPYLVQLTDNTPPVKPQELSGMVDSMGIVRLNWFPNPDEDIYGYRIFRSASGNDEFSQRTHRPIADTFYIDTIISKIKRFFHFIDFNSIVGSHLFICHKFF